MQGSNGVYGYFVIPGGGLPDAKELTTAFDQLNLDVTPVSVTSGEVRTSLRALSSVFCTRHFFFKTV